PHLDLHSFPTRRSSDLRRPAHPPVVDGLLSARVSEMSTPRRRATDRVRARPVGFFGYLRLRHKLALMLTIAALLPVLGASTVAIDRKSTRLNSSHVKIS